MEHSVPFGMMQAVRQSAAENKQAIVAAARQLLISEGPGVSMRSIAKKAGVGVATVSRHFPERLSLLDAVTGAEVAHIKEEVDSHLQGFDEDPEGTWRDIIHRIASLNFAAVVQAAAAEVNTASFSDDDVQEIATQRKAELKSIYQPIIEPTRQAGLCPESLTPLELHIGIGLITRPLPRTPVSADYLSGIQAQLIDTLLDGLKAQARAN